MATYLTRPKSVIRQTSSGFAYRLHQALVRPARLLTTFESRYRPGTWTLGKIHR